MKKSLLSLGMALLVTILSFAQTPARRTCGSMDVLNEQMANDPGLAARRQAIEQQTAAYLQSQNVMRTGAVITIPVVFHVVYSSTSQNISDAQCQAQIDQLNLDYARMNADASSTPTAFQTAAANTNIQFCLAQRDPSGNPTTGIERRQTTTSSFSTNDAVKYTSRGGMDAWPAGSYLNIWSCNLGQSLLGYAQFPGGAAATDGVVLLFSSIGSVARAGTATPYNLGRTATHEVGHWLNLYHIWGDDNGSCSGSDNVGDTPNQAGENYGCPSFPRTDACTSTSPGVMFMNYMDYTDDGCMNMFTNGQVSRMNALFGTGGSRASLLNSLGCQAPSTACGVPTSLSASSITTTSATISWAAVSGATSYNVQYKLSSSSTWTSTTTSSTSLALSGLSEATTYNYQVQAVCAAGAGSFSTAASFTTASSVVCGVPTGLASSSVTSTSATVSWTAVSGATSYNIQYKTSAATTWTTVTSTTTSRSITGLTASTTYNYQVAAVCSGGTSAYSAAASFTTSAATTGCTDAFESNNTSSAARTITTNTNINALISSSTDRDWFRFTTTTPNTYIRINLSNLPADYDIRLYNSSLTQLAISQNGSTTAEVITRNTTAAGTYFIQVYGYNGAFNANTCYLLRVNVGSVAFRTAEESVNLESIAAPSLNEMVVYPNPANESITAEFNSSVAENASIRIFDMVGKTMISSSQPLVIGNNKINFDLATLTKGIYFIELNSSSERIVKKFVVEK